MDCKVSVIVIGYNIEKYISNCLDSLINQTYDNIEILFINDGSKDATLDIAREYETKNDIIRVIDKKNGGIVSARKEGVRNAKGEYICFVDGDDWAPNNMVESLVSGIEFDSRKCDIVVSNFYAQKENGAFDFYQNGSVNDVMMGDEFLKNILDDTIPHYMFAKLYNRLFLVSSGYLDYMEVTMAEDWMTNAILGIHNPRVHFINDCCYYYRFNPSSCSRDGSNKLLEQIKTIDFIVNTFKKNGLYDKYKDYLDYMWFAYAFNYASNPNVHFYVKKQLLVNIKPKLKNWKSNTIVERKYPYLSKKRRLIFEINYIFPNLSMPLNCLYTNIKKNKLPQKENYLEKAHNHRKEYKEYLNSLKINPLKKTLVLKVEVMWEII